MVLNPVWKLLSSFHKWSLLSDLKLEPPPLFEFLQQTLKLIGTCENKRPLKSSCAHPSSHRRAECNALDNIKNVQAHLQ